jgi:cytochrome c-type biogenesis protein CcmE
MKIGLIIGGMVILFCTAIAAVALTGSSRKSISFAEARHLSEPCEIYGAVVPNSTSYDMASSRLAFKLQEEKTGAVMPVVYTKVKPASFEQASHVKAIGMFSSDHFQAEDLLVKCPSKYNTTKDPKAYATGKQAGERTP